MKGDTYMTKVTNRVISIYNRKTSMRLATEEWAAFDAICQRENLKRKKLLEMICDHKNRNFGLTCYVRLFTVAYMHQMAIADMLKNKANDNHKDIYKIFHQIS